MKDLPCSCFADTDLVESLVVGLFDGGLQQRLEAVQNGVCVFHVLQRLVDPLEMSLSEIESASIIIFMVCRTSVYVQREGARISPRPSACSTEATKPRSWISRDSMRLTH